MKLRFSLLSLCVLLAGAAARPAAAGDAYYFPDGLLYVPRINMQDNGGNTVTNYAAFFRRHSGWNFRLYGLAPAAPAAGGSGTNFVTSYVTNYVAVSNFVTLTNFVTVTSTNDGTNVYVTTNVFVTTNLVVTTNVNVTTTLIVVTNVPPPAVANVAGTWRIYFNEHYGRTFTGTEFGRTTNGLTPVTFNLTLTLTQTGADVAGTGLVDSVQYALSGEVTNDFFVFTMLAGNSNRTVNLVAGQALVGDGELVGDYSWSTTNAAKVNVGDFYAEKQ